MTLTNCNHKEGLRRERGEKFGFLSTFSRSNLDVGFFSQKPQQKVKKEIDGDGELLLSMVTVSFIALDGIEMDPWSWWMSEKISAVQQS